MTKRRGLPDDDPLDMLDLGAGATDKPKAKAPAKPKTPEPAEVATDDEAPGEARQRLTVTLPPSLSERARDLAWRDRIPLAHVVEEALANYLAAIEAEGGPIEERPTAAQLKQGRPVRPRSA